MILTREQVVFCRIKLKCFWPAQIKSIKKGSAVEVKFINRLDLAIQTKPETDIVSFEEGLDKAKSSTQQGIEKAIEKAQEIILSQSKVKKQSNIQSSSVIRQELEHKEKNTQISRITRADTMASQVKGKIEVQKDKLRSKSIVKTGNSQAEVASKSQKHTVTQIETLKEKGMASSLSKIKVEIPKIKIRIGSASSSKILSTGVGKTSIINLPNLLNSKIAKKEHQIKSEVVNGKRKREELKDITTEEEIKLQKKQKIDTPKVEKRITQNHQEVRKILQKKEEKLSEKINFKRETRPKEQKSQVFSKISTKTLSPKKTKKIENKTKSGGSSHKKKRENYQNSQLEEKCADVSLEVKVEEEFDVGQAHSPTNKHKNKSKRLQETNNNEYSYMDEEQEDGDKYSQESPDFGIKKGSFRYYQQDMNNNNGSNNSSFSSSSSYQNSIFSNTSSQNWANSSSSIYKNNNSNHGMQETQSISCQSNHLPSFGNSTNSSNNRGYFDASDELNFVAPAHPVEEEKCGLSVAQQRGLLYTGLKSGAISAQQFEFLSSQLEVASQMPFIHSLQPQQQQQQAQQQTQQLFCNSSNLQNTPSNLQQPRTPFGNITQSVLNNAQSTQTQGSSVSYFKQQQNPCDFTQNMAFSQNSTQPSHLSPTQNRDLPCFGSATFTTSSFDDPNHISSTPSSSSSSSSSNQPSSLIQGSFVNCPIRMKLSQKILPMLENKAKNKVQYENEKDMWLCEVVECVRQLKAVPPQQLYEGEYSMILEQVYDMIIQIQDQTKRNLTYVLSMITRTMADLDKKVIKHLHDFPSIATPSQVRNTTKIEDSLIHSSGFSSIELEKSQEPKQLLQPMATLHKIEQENNQYPQYLTSQPQSAEKMSPSQNRHNRFPETEQESTSKKLTDNSSEQCTPSDLANRSTSETLPLALQGNPSQSPPRKAAQIKEEEQGHFQV